MDEGSKKIAIFVSYSGQGGVERVINLLSGGFLDHGVKVDLVTPRLTGGHADSIPSEVNLVKLGSRHTYSSLFPLAGYLKKERPDALLAVKHRAVVTAVLARSLSGYKGRLVGSIHTDISGSLHRGSPLKRTFFRWGVRFFYPRTDVVAGVSEGVARDIRGLSGLPPDRVAAVYNPVVTPEIRALARQPLHHPWFSDGGLPVILGIGRLTRQKDFHTLLRAFAEVVKSYPCRLVILGEGEDLQSLRDLTKSLGIEKVVDFPGFQKNPYSFLARSRLFVLSSRWEGFGMVIVEAMALGTPVVSTDCPSGPREILKGGLYGPLVPPGNPSLLARAIVRTMENPVEAGVLISSSGQYTVEDAVERYLEILLEKQPR